MNHEAGSLFKSKTHMSSVKSKKSPVGFRASNTVNYPETVDMTQKRFKNFYKRLHHFIKDSKRKASRQSFN